MSKYDLSLYTAEDRLVAALGPRGAQLTGPLKAAQQFASLFLTEQGSVTYKPDYGTEFMYYMRFGLIRTDLDVVLYFNQSTALVLDYINGVHDDANDTTPDDEIIINIHLDNFTLEPPVLLLYVTLTMRSGATTKVVLPVTAGVEVPDAN